MSKLPDSFTPPHPPSLPHLSLGCSCSYCPGQLPRSRWSWSVRGQRDGFRCQFSWVLNSSPLAAASRWASLTVIHDRITLMWRSAFMLDDADDQTLSNWGLQVWGVYRQPPWKVGSVTSGSHLVVLVSAGRRQPSVLRIMFTKMSPLSSSPPPPKRAISL